MKIINREQFLKMPPGTVYSKYTPCIFGPLAIKGETVSEADWNVQPISDAIEFNNDTEFYEILTDAQANGRSIRLDLECETRDGLFDHTDLFAVWEAGDVSLLIERMQKALRTGYC